MHIRAERQLLLDGLILLLMTTIPYLVALDAPMVYDDLGQIIENPYLSNPAHAKNIVSLQTLSDPTIINGRRPLVLLSHLFNRIWWGEHPVGYRLCNLAIHLFNVLLLYGLACAIPLFARKRAMMAAGLFAIHPLLSSAVHMPAFRADLLCAAGILIYLVSFLRSIKSGPRKLAFFLLGMAGFAIALLSKESAVAGIALIIWVWLFSPKESRRFYSLVPWIALPVITSGVLFLAAQNSGPWQATSGAWNGISFQYPYNLLTLPWCWLKMLRYMIWPSPLSLDHIVSPVTTWMDARFWLGGISLVGSSILVILLSRKYRAAAFCIGWLLICFLPVSNLVPLINPFAERYAYMMMPGFTLLASLLLNHKRTWTATLRRITCWALFAVYLLLLLLRLPEWNEPERLWEQTLQVSPGSARARVWLGLMAEERGDRESAQTYYHEASQVNPQDASGLVNLGILFGKQGQLAQAEQVLQEALQRRPKNVSALWNYAHVKSLQGKQEESFELVKQVLKLAPRHEPAWKAYVGLMLQADNHAEALHAVKQLQIIDPENPEYLDAETHIRSMVDGGRVE